ncbi:hypothetical protein BHM03_00045889 [Ensete ventricosum]|nr:hypothetical protein BHM03_00045889 [Ensete ventricosum]
MAFSYNDEHQHPSLVEFGYLPCTPTEIPFLPQQSEDVTTSASSCFLHCYSQLPVADATGFGGSGSLDIAGLEPPSVANRVGHAPMVGEPGDGMAPKPQGSGEKKRKIDKDETSLITGQAKVRREKISERMKVLQSLVPGCEKVRMLNLLLLLKTTMMKLQSAVGSMPLPMSSSTVQANQLQPIAAAAAAMENGQAMRHSARFLLQGQGTTSFPEV